MLGEKNDSIIKVYDLHKHFKVYRHHRGALGAFRNLFTREYTEVHAVDGINFTVSQGELVGYIGPNGAGKSTTIKMLTGLLVPTSGALFVQDCVPWKTRRAYVARIGVVFGQRTTLWWDLPVIESLNLLQYIYRIPEKTFQTNLAEFRHLLALDPFLDTPVRSLSLGQRMRADLCAALIHNPPILFLDEPTIGLDIVAKERIRQFIQSVNQERGTTVILTTHDLSDVEKLCNRVMIIDHGKLLYDGSLLSLRNRFSSARTLIVDLAESYTDVEIKDARVVARENGKVTYQFDRNVITASELIGQLSAKYRIRDLTVTEPAIEDVIRRIYEERLLE
jgi:ABC-2 type transport system ATP-binding protein